MLDIYIAFGLKLRTANLYIFVFTENNRVLSRNTLGRQFVTRIKKSECSGIIHVRYCSRALEWVNMKKLFSEVFVHFSIPHVIPILLNLMFAWSFFPNVSRYCYKPATVFKEFKVAMLVNGSYMCICNKAKRFSEFIDPGTMDNNVDTPMAHVRTMDTHIVRHHGLREAIALGLNHIPLRNTKLQEAIQVVVDTFVQVCQVLKLGGCLDISSATKMVRTRCKDILMSAAKSNMYGFRYSKPYLFSEKSVENELTWLLKHVFISGLDKAANNACFICISHIRYQALARLNGPDFEPCCNNGTWESIESISSKITSDLLGIIPELPLCGDELPYIMAIYKFHKRKYRWISNAFGSIYVNIATLLTVSTMVILEEVKEWAYTRVEGYKNFLKANTSLYWIIDSINDFTLNVPPMIHNIYVADITRCFESIPVIGRDTLFEAIEFITSLGVSNMKRKFPNSEQCLWVKINDKGITIKAVWASSIPKHGNWVQLPITKFLTLHKWLTTNCFVRLGDRIWKQILGIPMGFSCSPLWCNLYLLSYEIKFIQRLARLGKADMMTKFQFAFRYIDDLCWLNVGNAEIFLDPQQPRTPDNPFWIYPLDIIEIKTEVSQFSQIAPKHGIIAHFMNVLIHVDEETSGKYTMQKFDKRRDLPFKYTQFIMFKSNRPVKQAYNVVISQTVPILYLSNNAAVAAQEVIALFTVLSSNGFRIQKLRQTVVTFLVNNHFPAIKFCKDELILLLRGMCTN